MPDLKYKWRDFLIWLWQSLTNDLIQTGIDPELLRNSIANDEYDTIQYWSRKRIT